jgi:hypothetical protein
MDFEKPKKQAVETAEVPIEPEKKKRSGLYDVEEIEGGGFDVILPGLIDKKSEAIVGTSRQRFETREEAEQAAGKARESVKVQLEKASLEKTFTPHFYNIKRLQDDSYRVTVPGAKSSETGYYLGSTHLDFGSWDEARDFYLSQRESDEQLVRNPLLELKTSENEKISFSDFNSYNPSVSPSEKKFEIMPSVESYILHKEKTLFENSNTMTYQNTIKEKGWEQKIFSFVDRYLKEGGVETAKKLGIERLDYLTPKQAAELSTQIVLDLRKYKDEDIAANVGETEADKMTTLEILKNGLNNKKDSRWKGNGICRNFTCATKAVFEALKANQTRFNLLRNTYALYDAGSEERYQPKRKTGDRYIIKKEEDEGRHAWNAFVTVSKEGEVDTTFVDVTWANRDLKTGQVENLDHTLSRMEALVHQAGNDLSDSAPDREGQIRRILSFYSLSYERLGQDKKKNTENEKQFLMFRALQLADRHGVISNLPPELIAKLGIEYQKRSDKVEINEIEALWTVHQAHKDLPMREIIEAYLKDKEGKRLSGRDGRGLVSEGEFKSGDFVVRDNQLQVEMFEQMKSRGNLSDLANTSPIFRSRMREVLPRLFVGFFPESKPVDAAELFHLVDKSSYMSAYRSYINPKSLSKESLERFFTRVRGNLEKLNPSLYRQNVAGMDSYQLVKQYDEIYEKLTKK